MEIATAKPIDPKQVYEEFKRKTAGSVVLRLALVRERTGNEIAQATEFRRHGDVESELKSIADDMRGRWRLEDTLIIHRLGVLQAGDVMSLVAATAPRRDQAFDACRHGVENLKQMQTIRTTER